MSCIKDLCGVRIDKIECYSFNELEPFQKNICRFRTIGCKNGTKYDSLTEYTNVLGMTFINKTSFRVRKEKNSMTNVNESKIVNGKTSKRKAKNRMYRNKKWWINAKFKSNLLKKKLNNFEREYKKQMCGIRESLYTKFKKNCLSCGRATELKNRILCVRCIQNSVLKYLNGNDRLNINK